jgi:hypothetical protein
MFCVLWLTRMDCNDFACDMATLPVCKDTGSVRSWQWNRRRLSLKCYVLTKMKLNRVLVTVNNQWIKKKIWINGVAPQTILAICNVMYRRKTGSRSHPALSKLSATSGGGRGSILSGILEIPCSYQVQKSVGPLIHRVTFKSFELILR